MARIYILSIIPLLLILSFTSCDRLFRTGRTDASLTGTESCRDCHENFYTTWDHSPHSGSTRPLTPSFTKGLYFDHKPISIKLTDYLPGRDGDLLLITESKSGSVIEIIQPVAVMGNRSNFFFISREEDGAFRVLPVAYNIKDHTWFEMRDTLLLYCSMNRTDLNDWEATDRVFTSKCFSCHVNPADSHYDPATNSYLSDKFEEGISCESCHGESEDHDRTMRALEPGEVPTELFIIKDSDFSHDQINALCYSCHVSAKPLTAIYPPGAKYYDHYNPEVTIADASYSIIAEKKGAFLFTGWESNPCKQSGSLDCLHCHDAGGNNRFSSSSDGSCTSCHTQIAGDISAHTWHPVESPGSRCIACHMPSYSRGGKHFTDHSFQAPLPMASIRTGTENACILCHKGKSNWWAQGYVKKWYPDNYQDSLVARRQIEADALSGRWSRKKDLAAYISADEDEVHTTALIRLLGKAHDTAMISYADPAAASSSPLARSAAIDIISINPNKQRLSAIQNASGDAYRIVRISAIAAMLEISDTLLNEFQLSKRDSLINQYAAYLLARPDDWRAYNDLGDLFFRTGKYSMALKAYESAININPRAEVSMISAGLSYARGGNLEMAIMMLRRAIEIEPGNEQAHWNLALLYLENQQPSFAEKEFKKVLEINEASSAAAYNLAVITSDRSITEAIRWIRKAIFYAPDEPKYIYTLSFYLNATGKTTEASGSLRDLIKRMPAYGPAYLLLGSIYEQEGMLKEARQLYIKGLSAPVLDSDKSAMSMKLQQVGG